jgi:tRNA modification GTPase
MGESTPFLNDTIAAIATAPGAAGLAVVRLSGERAIATADAVFGDGRRLAEAPSHTLHHGWAWWPEAVAADPSTDRRRLDEVVAAVFRAPRSYTREDVVELSCHGGAISAQRVMAALLKAGARLARPGEFTLRAFLNGRVDLAQAEAVADLIAAETEAAHRLALAQLAGELSRWLERLGERIMEALSEVEARVDFAEDVGGVEVPAHVIARVEEAGADLMRMLADSRYARAIREGVRLPLVGRPNVGKSSLFNALVGEERAIVTALPGTTRDRVSEAIEVAGIRVTLSDTAGLRHSSEPIEAIGVARTRQLLGESEVALWVVDGSVALDEDDRMIAEGLHGKRVLVAVNKHDLPARTAVGELEELLNGNHHAIVSVSAVRGDGLDQLHGSLARLLDAGGAAGPTLGLANLRHVESLGRAREALARAAVAGREGAPGEIVALELRECLDAIGEVTGRTIGADLLDRIFSRFCVGK